MREFIYEDLSYKLIGLAYRIDTQIGFGHSERIYSDSFEKLLQSENISYKRELYNPIKVDEHLIAKRYLDFLIDDKIIVEIKVGNYRFETVFNQVLNYLKINSLKLGIVIRFNKTGVQIKRVVNLI